MCTGGITIIDSNCVEGFIDVPSLALEFLHFVSLVQSQVFATDLTGKGLKS